MNENGFGLIRNNNMVWDDVSLQWVREVQPSTAGGSTVAPSTTVSVAGVVTVQQNSSVWQVQPGSTNWPKAAGLSIDSSNVQNVKLDGSTALTIGSIAATAGRLNIGSTASENAVTATPVSTAYVKSAGFSVDSSNALNMKFDGSTTATVQPLAGSTFNVRALNSSAADLQMTATPVAGSTWNVRPLQSSASDLKVSAFLFDSTGNGIESSTFAASTKTSTARGIVTRPAIPDCTSVGGIIATAGDNTLLSSAATSIYVYALTLSGMGASTGSPTAGSSAVILRIQNGTTSAPLWRGTYYQSSVNGWWDSIVVTPPAYLFKTSPATLLNLSATSTGGNYSLAAWRE